MALLIPNIDIASLPADVTPIPADILSSVWQFAMTPAQASATLPNSFGFVCLFGIDGDLRVALQDSGDAYRLDLFDTGGGTIQIGLMEWTGSPSIRIEIDTVNSTVTATTLSGSVTYGGGWDSVVGPVATRDVVGWTWTGTTLHVGGIPPNFTFDGTIQDVADAAGAGSFEDMSASAAGTSTASATLAALASMSASAAGACSVTSQIEARAALTASAAGTCTSTAGIEARALVSAQGSGTCSVTSGIEARANIAAAADGTSAAAALAVDLDALFVASASGLATTSPITLAIIARFAAVAAGSSEAFVTIAGGEVVPRTLEEILHFGWDRQPAKKVPEFGDPELLPKPIEYRGSAERPWFDLTGRAVDPDLPGDFPNAPDVRGLPWVRLRGDEWTTPAMRAAVLVWIGQRFEIDRKLTRWEVVETAAVSGSTTRAPVLMLRLWRGAIVREASSGIPEAMRNAESMPTILAAFLPVLSFDS